MMNYGKRGKAKPGKGGWVCWENKGGWNFKQNGWGGPNCEDDIVAKT